MEVVVKRRGRGEERVKQVAMRWEKEEHIRERGESKR